MSFRIDRTRRAVSARPAAQTGTDRKQDTDGVRSSNLPVAIGSAADVQRTGLVDRRAAFDAQLLGQDGQKRGLRGGTPVLEAARSAYCSVEWSGSRDRRARKGRIARDVA